MVYTRDFGSLNVVMVPSWSTTVYSNSYSPTPLAESGFANFWNCTLVVVDMLFALLKEF